MSIYSDIIEQINKKYRTNYKLGAPKGEGRFVNVFELEGYKNDSEYVGRFTLKPTTDDNWEWIKKKTIQEYMLLTRNDVNGQFVGKLCKTYRDEKDEWFFSIQKKYIPLSEHLRTTLGKTPSNKDKELIFSKIFAELSEALYYLHSLDYENSKGILLRDVKPENIMYDPETDRCILCDFNTAREFNIKEYWAGTTITVGTVEYMAPEIHLIEGGTEHQPSPRQDVYSLGATIFSLLTRKSTKEAVTTNQFGHYAREISDEKKIRALEKSGVSKVFQNIVYCAIQKDPEKRYQDAEELFTYVSLLYSLRKTEKEYQENLTELETVRTQINALQKRVETLNTLGETAETTYNRTIADLKKENDKLKKEIKKYKTDIASLQAKHTETSKALETHIRKNKSLAAKNKELENKKARRTDEEEFEADETKQKIYTIGQAINIIAVIVYSVLCHFNIVDKLMESEKSWILIASLLIPYLYAEIVAWKSEGKGVFFRVLLIEMPFVYIYLVYGYYLIPGTFISGRMAIDIVWAVLIFLISVQYHVYLRKTDESAHWLLCALVVFLTLMLSISLGFTPRCDAYAIGDQVVIGSYEQDGDETNGQEPLTWTVSAVFPDVAFLTCDKGIDYLPYHGEEKENVTWGESDLRTWLHSSFLNQAFTDSEKEKLYKIPLATDKTHRTLINMHKPEYNDDGIFIEDVNHSFWLRQLSSPTEYAKSKYEADENKKDKPWTWTRSPYMSKDNTTYIWMMQNDTWLHVKKVQPCTGKAYVRPVIIIPAKKD